MHIDDVLRVVADGWPQRRANKSNTPHAVAKVPSDIELLPLIMPSVLLPVEFDAEAKFARNKTATHAAAKGPSDTELLPLIMPSVLLPVEFDAAAKCTKPLTANTNNEQSLRQVIEDMISEGT